MSNEQTRRRARGKTRNISDEQRHDVMVLTEFVKRPNRAMAVPEMTILLGGQASFNVAASFDRLEAANKIYKTETERHIGPTLGDAVTTSPRYRRAK